MCRPCIDCGAPANATRCPHCAALRKAHRARNYGPVHQAARRALALTLPTPCWYCERIVTEGERWVAAHQYDGDPASPRVVAHATCNERAKIAVL